MDRKSDEDEDYATLKAWAEFLRLLCYITYMDASGPSLLIESVTTLLNLGLLL